MWTISPFESLKGGDDEPEFERSGDGAEIPDRTAVPRNPTTRTASIGVGESMDGAGSVGEYLGVESGVGTVRYETHFADDRSGL